MLSGLNARPLRKSLEALQEYAGRLLNVQAFGASGICLPTPGRRSALIEIIGGAGSGAGVAATGPGQFSVSTGGSAGAYALVWIPDMAAIPVAVTVGLGGAAIAGFASNAGAASAFGPWILCPGGPGGGSAGPATGAFYATPPGYSAAPSTSIGVGLILMPGGGADTAFASGSGLVIGTAGATSYFGAGGLAPGGAGGISPSYGAGGGGCSIGSSTAAQLSGKGGDGRCLVYEFGA